MLHVGDIDDISFDLDIDYIMRWFRALMTLGLPAGVRFPERVYDRPAVFRFWPPHFCACFSSAHLPDVTSGARRMQETHLKRKHFRQLPCTLIRVLL